jgi:hypothetical protein
VCECGEDVCHDGICDGTEFLDWGWVEEGVRKMWHRDKGGGREVWYKERGGMGCDRKGGLKYMTLC